MAEKSEATTMNPAETSDAVLKQMEDAAQQEAQESASEEKAAPSPQQPQQGGGEKKPSKLNQYWEKTGLDPMTLKMMFKGSLPPIIAISMYQSTAASDQYSTLYVDFLSKEIA